jgi:hypothetical protein
MAKKHKVEMHSVPVQDAAQIMGVNVPAGFAVENGGSVAHKITFLPGFGVGSVLDGGTVSFTINDVAEVQVIETTRMRFRRF